VILWDLATDLEYFVANPVHRREDPSFFGPKKAASLLAKALREIDDLLAQPKSYPRAFTGAAPST